jgi:hypothetical protein
MRILLGQNIKNPSTQLGHTSIDITMDHYEHLFNDKDFIGVQVAPLDASVRNSLKKGKEKGDQANVTNA